MPKTKQPKAKSSKGGKSANTAKLPKQVAGVKISRELRNAVEPVLRFAGHPLVSDALAAALLAGADALTGKKGKQATAGAGKKASDPIGLMVAMAAGEIASRIVAAYQAPAEERRESSDDRRSGSDRRSKTRKPPGGKERRSTVAERRTAKDRRG